MFEDAARRYRAQLDDIAAAALMKEERTLAGPQGARIHLEGSPPGHQVLNLSANNYLGFANHPRLVAAAKQALSEYGFGLSSVRFIAGTQTIHLALERALARFFGTEDAILYSSCFDANGGLFETLLGEDDAVISDALNHASIIDGIRLCKAERHRYPHGDMKALEERLQSTADKRLRLIATDGVFSMDGYLANLPQICNLADRYRAIVMVDDSHATGFLGPSGRGTPEHFGCAERVDLITGTFGKALGGASGGFVTGRAEAVALLRQRSRPYLFSNTLAPLIAASSLEALTLIDNEPHWRHSLLHNARHFRHGIVEAGFTIRDGFHPIVPIMIGDAPLAKLFAERLLQEGLYVVAFSYPVVPLQQARIRVQISAVHTQADLDAAIRTLTRVGLEVGILRGSAG